MIEEVFMEKISLWVNSLLQSASVMNQVSENVQFLLKGSSLGWDKWEWINLNTFSYIFSHEVA